MIITPNTAVLCLKSDESITVEVTRVNPWVKMVVLWVESVVRDTSVLMGAAGINGPPAVRTGSVLSSLSLDTRLVRVSSFLET
jgi:hypothetical protein